MTAPTPIGDPVFAAFCAAGLWPGLGRRAAAELPAAGITSPDDVTADRLLKLPRVGRQRAERLFSGFLSAQPTYEVVALLVGAGLDAKLASTAADALGNDAARRLRDRPCVIAPVVGARTAQQLQAVLDADGVRLPPAICTALDDVSSPHFSYPERRPGQ